MPRFKAIKRELVYYGDISNAFPAHNTDDDAASRRRTLASLRAWNADQFVKRNYERLPGKTALKEFLADTFGGIASAIGTASRSSIKG